MRIHYLQHVPFEGPAHVAKWAGEKGHPLTGTQLFKDEELPGLNRFDLLVIMGGPMNIYEEDKYPWLKGEKEFIKAAIEAGKAVLGICLGAQLIADVLGGEVTRNPHIEIGWFPVRFNCHIKSFEIFKDFPEEVTVFHWHGDTFSKLGEGAVSIAESQACKNQGFIFGDRVIGFQFHIEGTAEGIGSLIENCADEMSPGDYVQSGESILANLNYLARNNQLTDILLEQLALLCGR